MARRTTPPVDCDEEGMHVPNLGIRLPELIADATDGDPDDFAFPVDCYPIPSLEDQDLEPVE